MWPGATRARPSNHTNLLVLAVRAGRVRRLATTAETVIPVGQVATGAAPWLPSFWSPPGCEELGLEPRGNRESRPSSPLGSTRAAPCRGRLSTETPRRGRSLSPLALPRHSLFPWRQLSCAARALRRWMRAPARRPPGIPTPPATPCSRWRCRARPCTSAAISSGSAARRERDLPSSPQLRRLAQR
jgi:hypothetical protein